MINRCCRGSSTRRTTSRRAWSTPTRRRRPAAPNDANCAASPHLARVRCLRFDHCEGIADGSLIALAGSPHAAALEALDIDGIAGYSRRLTTTGLEPLGRSANLPALRSLRLEHCRIPGQA